MNTDFILLFGLFAKGTSRPDSAIDLAYFSKDQLSSYERFLLTDELSEIAGREVDLIDPKQIDTVLKSLEANVALQKLIEKIENEEIY